MDVTVPCQRFLLNSVALNSRLADIFGSVLH